MHIANTRVQTDDDDNGHEQFQIHRQVDLRPIVGAPLVGAFRGRGPIRRVGRFDPATGVRPAVRHFRTDQRHVAAVRRRHDGIVLSVEQYLRHRAGPRRPVNVRLEVAGVRRPNSVSVRDNALRDRPRFLSYTVHDVGGHEELSESLRTIIFENRSVFGDIIIFIVIIINVKYVSPFRRNIRSELFRTNDLIFLRI